MPHTRNAQPDSEQATPATLTLADKEGRPIRTLEDWYAFAPPKKPVLHWRDGRSAKECAKAWLRGGVPGVPGEILEVLNAHPLTAGFVGVSAVPEATIQFDNVPGEHRNADMLLVGEAQGKKVVVTIEAKVDEAFGPVVGEYYDDHPRPRSRVQDRIDGLVSAMFGRGLDEEVRALRYQLLHGTAATLVAAGTEGAEVAVFLVHVFKTQLCDPVKAERNRADWTRFVEFLDEALERLGGTDSTMQPKDMSADYEGLHGPYQVPGGGFVPAGIPLLMGYCISKTATLTAAG